MLASAPSAEEPPRASRPIALDGKPLRGTIPTGSSTGVHLLSAYAGDCGGVLAQEAVARKESEIVAAPRLLQRLNLCGTLISGDAMVTHRALRTQIVEGGGEYCWTVKETQPLLL